VPRQRLGVALLVPPPVSIEIDALRRALGETDVDRIPPHLTLIPPVNVREDDIAAGIRVLGDAAATCPPLRLQLGPVTTFAPASPTVHLAVGGDVDEVHALRDRVFVPPLARTLTHEFVPHVTLVEGSDRIEESVRVLADYRAEVALERVHLMRESRREDGTRIWRPIADADLGRARAVVGRGGLPLELTTGGVLPMDADRWVAARWDELDVERYGAPRAAATPLSIVARRDGEIVAVAVGEVRRPADEAYLGELMVRSDLRGEGVGAHVVAAFASAAAEHGASFLSLRTEAVGRARPFYERLGFTEWYLLPAWRNGRDFVQMRRPL